MNGKNLKSIFLATIIFVAFCVVPVFANDTNTATTKTTTPAYTKISDDIYSVKLSSGKATYVKFVQDSTDKNKVYMLRSDTLNGVASKTVSASSSSYSYFKFYTTYLQMHIGTDDCNLMIYDYTAFLGVLAAWVSKYMPEFGFTAAVVAAVIGVCIYHAYTKNKNSNGSLDCYMYYTDMYNAYTKQSCNIYLGPKWNKYWLYFNIS